MKIYIVRHGETDWNSKRKWQGWVNTSLNDKGKGQAEKTATKLDSFEISKIYTSPLNRAMETAEIINSKINVELEEMDSLKEINFGEWEGLTLAEIRENYGEAFECWEDRPFEEVGFGVENVSKVQERAFKSLLDICSTNDGDVLIVSHSLWIRALVCKVLCIPLESRMTFELENAGITVIEKTEDKFMLKTLNA